MESILYTSEACPVSISPHVYNQKAPLSLSLCFCMVLGRKEGGWPQYEISSVQHYRILHFSISDCTAVDRRLSWKWDRTVREAKKKKKEKTEAESTQYYSVTMIVFAQRELDYRRKSNMRWHKELFPFFQSGKFGFFLHVQLTGISWSTLEEDKKTAKTVSVYVCEVGTDPHRSHSPLHKERNAYFFFNELQ